MSKQSAITHHERVIASGGARIQTRLTKEGHQALLDLSIYHRLTQREIIERLLRGIPLGRHDANLQQRMGMTDSEWDAFTNWRSPQ